MKAKKTIVLKEENSISTACAADSEVVDDDFAFVDNDVIEIDVDEKEGEQIIPIMPSPEPIKEVAEFPRKKKKSESSTSTPVVIKKKKVARETKTQLLDGEASVEDILNLFDPS